MESPRCPTKSRIFRTPIAISALAVALLAGALAGCGGNGANEPQERPEKQSLNLEKFTSPKGNIGCIATDKVIRCDIRKKTWTVKPNPDCPVDWGNGLSVGKGPGRIVCAGDTVMGQWVTLGAGNLNMVGPFECETGPAGNDMRCDNVHTGHGFELSPDEYRVF